MIKLAFRRGSEERGVTLIETLLVLGIATAFIAGGIGLYNQAQTAQENRDAVTDVYSIIAAARGTFGGTEDYRNIGFAPIGIATAPTPWGTTMNVDAVELDGNTTITGAAPAFVVTITGITQTQCIFLSSSLSEQFGIYSGNALSTGARSGVTDVTAPRPGPCIPANTVIHIYAS